MKYFCFLIGFFVLLKANGNNLNGINPNGASLLSGDRKFLTKPPKYDTLSLRLKNGLSVAGIKKDQLKFGLVNKRGAWIIPCEYDSIRKFGSNLIFADSTDQYSSVFDIKGKSLFRQIENVQALGDSVFTFQKNGKLFVSGLNGKLKYNLGLKDYIKGKPIFFPLWSLVDTTFKELAVIEADSIVFVSGYLISYLNSKNHIVFPKAGEDSFDEIRLSVKDQFIVKKGNHWGIIDKNGKVEVPCQYDSISYKNGLYVLKSNGKYGAMDNNFKLILPDNYLYVLPKHEYVNYKTENTSGFIKGTFKIDVEGTDSLTFVSDTLLLAWQNEHCTLLNHKKDTISAKKFRQLVKVSDTLLAAFDQDSLYNYRIDSSVWRSKKEKVIAFYADTLGLAIMDTTLGMYHFLSDSIFLFEGDTAWKHPQLQNKLLTKKGEYYGIAAIEGRLLTNYHRQLKYIGKPENGFMEVISRRKYGFVDTNGYLLISTRYDSVKPVRDGYAAVKLKGKWGYVNRKETIVVQPNYTKATGFMGNCGPVWLGNLATLADDNGKELFKPRFHYLSPTKGGYWLSRKSGLYGFLQQDGKEIFNPRFSKVIETGTGHYIVRQYEKDALLNRKLETVLPFEKREIQYIKGSNYFLLEKASVSD